MQQEEQNTEEVVNTEDVSKREGANPDHDFATPINTTSRTIAIVFIKTIAENIELMLDIPNMQNEEEKAEAIKKIDAVMQGLFTYLETTDIPADYATKGIEDVIAIFEQTKQYINGVLRRDVDEILSRFIGQKSPKTGRYAKDVAKYSDVKEAVKRVREMTGNDMFDYFDQVN